MKPKTIIANEPIEDQKLKQAQKIILALQQNLKKEIAKGSGPFMAAIYDQNGHLVAKSANSVVADACSHHHAEMNVIKKAEKKLKTYDLSAYHLKLYTTAEPCMMCLGGILWAGIKEVYYGVPTAMVESITGFYEGIKPNWLKEFKKLGITVYGQIEVDVGKQVLQEYVDQKHPIYKPVRK